MDRRFIGALLVVAVITLAIAVPARGAVRIAGRPVAIALPAEPRLGDCLLAPVTGGRPGSNSVADSAVPDQSTVGSAVFGPCAGMRLGEVVAVTGTSGGKEATGGARSAGTDCRRAALGYAGLAEIGGDYLPHRQVAADVVHWTFSLDVRANWMLAPALSQAAGRTWAACVVQPADGSSYPGSLADAYGGGRLPDQFGLCWASGEVTVAAKTVACSEPHLAELIALGTIGREDATPADVGNSCDRLAGAVMGRADPTAGGGLTIRTNPDTGDSLRWAKEPMGVICYVVPSARPLTGTLVGLGDRPVPYAG